MIPVYKPFMAKNQNKYVMECLETNWISSRGKFINDFELTFSKYTGIASSTTVANGTVALHLALVALGIKAGDEVIVPTLTYIATINAIKMVGAKPVFIDCNISDLQINPDEILDKITINTKAILVVHLYGYPSNMDIISKICNKNKIYLIEDCAEAFGTYINGKHVGNFGDICTFSFFGNKTITTGEGGMICSNNIDLINKCAYLKSQAVSKDIEYWHDELGYNYRMTNISAAIGLAQLEEADLILSKKLNIASYYHDNLAGYDVNFIKESSNIKNSYWMNTIIFNSESIKNNVRVNLAENGIETRPLFYPAHLMPVYYDKSVHAPNSEYIHKLGINIPSYPDLSRTELDIIIRIIKSTLINVKK